MAAKAKDKQKQTSAPKGDAAALGADVNKIASGKAATSVPAAPQKIDVNTPTIITATPVEDKEQAVQIDITKHIDTMKAKVDTILLIDSLEDTRNALANEVKGALMKAGAKWADGDDAIGQLGLNGTPSEIQNEEMFKLLTAKKITLARLVEIGAIKFIGDKLANVLTGDEIKAVSKDGKPKLPSLLVVQAKGKPPVTVLTALERLTGAALKDSKLFVEPKSK